VDWAYSKEAQTSMQSSISMSVKGKMRGFVKDSSNRVFPLYFTLLYFNVLGSLKPFETAAVIGFHSHLYLLASEPISIY